jgi:hypothetical protein
MQRFFALSLLCVWPLLTGLAVIPSMERSQLTPTTHSEDTNSTPAIREEWLGVYQNEEKVGYLQRRLFTTHTGYEWEEHWWLSLRLLDDVETTHTEVHAQADRACALTSFSLWSVGAGTAMYVKADIVHRGTPQQEIQGESISNGDAMPFTLPLSLPLQLPPLCQMAVPSSTRPGTSREFSVFNPLLLRTEFVNFTTVGTELMNVDGRPHKVIKLVSELSEVSLYTWLDTEGRVIKEEIAPDIFLRRETPISARSGDWQEKGWAPHLSTADFLDAPEEE